MGPASTTGTPTGGLVEIFVFAESCGLNAVVSEMTVMAVRGWGLLGNEREPGM
jgi:hypothetical protein